ncbi:hypothetical protein [Sporosarcina sp. FSL W7-1283]|uniref:hypothetical protein n=1 Tax=Sporosarcina sp. FSL W7-1283 TaxID=2921560 RepID=UPI0030F5CBA7
MNRLSELLHKKDQFLYDEEIIIYVKDGEMITRYSNGENLIELSGAIDEKLLNFIDWVKHH